KFPGHSLADEILFAKATIAERRNLFEEAEKLYLEIIKNYSFDILADNAVFQLAQLYEFKLKDLEKAKKMYETIILNYTGSLYITEARKRFRNLRGDVILDKEQ
ncbi:MAG TPA: tetratricopeptide repeat protein, partial [Bacteroidia bacterium]